MSDTPAEAGGRVTAAADRYQEALRTLLDGWDDAAAQRISHGHLDPVDERTQVVRQKLGDVAEAVEQARHLCRNIEHLGTEAERHGREAREALEHLGAALAEAGTSAGTADTEADQSHAHVTEALRLLGRSGGPALADLRALVEQGVVRERRAGAMRLAGRELAKEAAKEVAWQVSEGFVGDVVARGLGVSGGAGLPDGAMTGFREAVAYGHAAALVRIGNVVRALRRGVPR